ncbi:exportin-7-like isoform X2 [Halichondria panicea]|uniref:exportin-7-like isoform X2 n=1 Tax=Halichondria panicea TaxID=6063 RepID=UPI00312B4304
MDEQQLSQLELLCQQLYESHEPEVRLQAEKALVGFTESQESLPQCQMVLERSQSAYALLLASSTLTKLVTRATSNVSIQDRLQLRNYVLQYLGNRLGLTGFVTQALIQLIARITKHGWFDGDKKVFVFRDILDEAGTFLRGSVDHCVVGVQILHTLVVEMNQVESMRSLTNHRKVASSFKDESLYDIFTLSCTLLRQINVHDKTQAVLISWLLKLACACLSFDFIGTSTDESADDLATVQIPTAWRSTFLDCTTLQLFFNLFHSLSSDLAHMSITCLVQLASVRRSLFNNVERSTFLAQLVKGVCSILDQPQTLADPECYHEFCRLLMRLKSNYQLVELMKLDSYTRFLEVVAKFTLSSLQSWQFSGNSIHYLLGFWQRMVGSVPYIRSSEPHQLDTYVPELTKTYVTSRLESVETVIADSLDNPLDDQTMVSQQLEQMATIGRCEYSKTCQVLMSLFDQTASSYQEILANPSSAPSQQMALREGQLAWLVYLIGSVIGGRISHMSADDYDSMDGQLVCRVLQLMNLTDSQLPQHGSENLDQSFLHFFEQFRVVYVGDVISKTSGVYQALSERLGLNDESMVLNVFVNKIVTNLKFWTSSKTIVTKTLQLLTDLSIGYGSVRKLVKLESVKFILENHTPDHFPFLNVAHSNLDLGCRTLFYVALARLLLVELGESEEKFERFISPLNSVTEQLQANFVQQTMSEDELKRTLVALCRDLTGVARSFTSKTSYMMLFDWVYPTVTTILLKALDVWYFDPFVTSPVLRLITELVLNRSQRLQFDVTSPNGVLLFREASKTITSFGEHILTLTDIPADKIYPLKLKGISICFEMLKGALCGTYVNFGVFRLYGDDALDKALNTFIKLMVSIPLKDLLEYPKLSKCYYDLLEVLTQDHMEFVSTLEPEVFIYILSTISEGLTGLNAMVCTGCCSTLDHILAFLFKKLSSSKGPISPTQRTPFLRILELHPEILQQMLSSIMNIIMFEECRNQWSMSRPLLGLILLNEEYFKDLRERMVALQPAERQEAMMTCFENLMEGIERNLQSRNRDNFTKNLSVFRRNINNSLKGVVSTTTSAAAPHFEMMV